VSAAACDDAAVSVTAYDDAAVSVAAVYDETRPCPWQLLNNAAVFVRSER
jgi:hypothetical protein